MNSSRTPGEEVAHKEAELPHIATQSIDKRLHELINIVKTLSSYVQKVYSLALTVKYEYKESMGGGV